MLFAFLCTDKPGHLNVRMDTRPTHLEHLNKLNAEGTLKMAGPFLDDDGKPNGLCMAPAMDQQIPNDRNHLHFGAGETEARIELPPGKHTLPLLLGDQDHVPHDPPIHSGRITVTVP